MYFVPEVFVDVCCKMYGLRRTVCCQVTRTWSSQSHNYTRRTWAIQRYRELLKLIEESMESSVSYYGGTSMYITLPESASSCHILAITFMIQKLYATHFMVEFCLITYKYSYKIMLMVIKCLDCSFLSEPLKLFSTLKHLANPTSKSCRWRIALITHIFSSLTYHFEI